MRTEKEKRKIWPMCMGAFHVLMNAAGSWQVPCQEGTTDAGSGPGADGKTEDDPDG